MSKESSLCRPDTHHWCVECCSERQCSNLDKLPDGTTGCLGHGERTDLGGLLQSPFCQKFDCLTITGHNSSAERERIRELIFQQPEDEFKMSKILNKTHTTN